MDTITQLNIFPRDIAEMIVRYQSDVERTLDLLKKCRGKIYVSFTYGHVDRHTLLIYIDSENHYDLLFKKKSDDIQRYTLEEFTEIMISKKWPVIRDKNRCVLSENLWIGLHVRWYHCL